MLPDRKEPLCVMRSLYTTLLMCKYAKMTYNRPWGDVFSIELSTANKGGVPNPC